MDQNCDSIWLRMERLFGILLLLTSLQVTAQNTKNANISEMTEFIKYLDQAKYDNRVRPNIDTGIPVRVEMNFFVNTISTLSEVHMEYTINIYMRQKWIDPRLQHNYSTVTLSHQYGDKLWVPDLFFKNEKQATFHDVAVPNRLITISPDGTVMFSQRLSLTLSCNMHLGRFPLDVQHCPLFLESYGYTTKDLQFYWREKDPIQLNEKIKLPEFDLTKSELGNCTVAYITGAFTCVNATFTLERQFTYYLIQTYIPSMLVVFLSWVSFWIDRHAVPARITLGLLTVLTISTQSSSSSERLPKVSYVKALDVWQVTCLVFVFGALIEYSVVNVLSRREYNTYVRKKGHDQEETGEPKSEDDSQVINTASANGAHRPDNPEIPNGQRRPSATPSAIFRPSRFQRLKHDKALMVDVLSRIFFPLLFVGFNLLYWLIVFFVM